MKKLYSVLFLLLPLFIFSQTSDLMITKYGEGTSNNKFIEIYNGTGADVDLSNYSLSSCSNGCDTADEWDYPDNVTFPAGTIIANGDVYVVTHGSADASIASDQTFTYLSNGDDAFALTLSGATADSYTIIDILGDMQGDPGSGWDVAGVSNGTKEHTLTRKTSVCSPNPTPLGSFGTDADDSEWVVGDQNSGWDTVGSYTTACVSSTAESLPWSDSFENGLSSWTNTSSTPWAVDAGDDYGPGSVTDGTSAIFFNDYDFSSGTTGDIVSPELDLTSATNVQLTFDYWDSGGSDNVEVLVNGAVVYTTANSVNPWETITVDLTSYVGANATVGFRGTSVWGTSNPHVDNVMVAAYTPAESIPWSDSFENGLSSWTNTSSTPWAVDAGDDYGPGSVTDGTSAIFFNDYDFSSGTTGDIVSPELDLTSATNVQLTFDYWDSGGSDNVEVLVNGAVVYTTANSVNPWETITVDLTSYVGANATVGFRGTSVWGTSNPHVDNVMVAEAPTAASADWDVSATNFSDSATVSVTTDNFTVTDDGSGDGHWHYALDGGSTVMVYDTNDVVLTGLSSGDHTLVAWLVDNAHADLDPAVTETITWTQTNAPGCGESLSYDYGTGSSGGYNFDGNFTGPDAADLLFTSTVVTAGDEITVTLGGTTESGYDWVYVTDGAGNVLQAPISGTMGDVAVTSTDGTVNVYLASDSSVTSGPVTFTVTCQTPAGDPNTILADPTNTWNGYMNVFDLTGGAQGGYQFGQSWGVADLATTLNADADYMTITLEPNYNAYNADDAYWSDGSGGGNKWMEANTYVESSTEWNNADLTFTGYVYQHTLAADWTASFFVKALDPNNGYADALGGAYLTALPTDGQFTVTVPSNELSAGLIVQAGFTVAGPNANPENQTANGRVIVGGDADAPMSINDPEDVLNLRIYPNPVNDGYVNILSPVNGIKYVEVFDINGRKVIDTAINNNTLDVSSINSGFYMIKVTIDGQTKISKLVVR